MNSQQNNLSEQDMLNDMLIDQKHLISAYSTFITECTCPNLRNVLTDNFEQNCQDQYTTFDWMRKKGYYQIKQVPQQEVQNAKQKFTQVKSGL